MTANEENPISEPDESRSRAIGATEARRAIHLRRIHCQGFERADGLFDIEGTLIDTKPVPTALPEKTVAAGAAIHHMTLRLTIDRERRIHDAAALTVEGPYRVCGDINASYRRLVGLRIEPGFTDQVKRMFRRTLGCSHLTELLPPMATTAFQMLWAEPEGFGGADAEGSVRRTSPLGGCHALRVDGEVVRLHFPELLGAPQKA